MPKLLQINVTANWGSTGKIAEQIGVLAQKQGWESNIAYGRHMNASENKLIKIGSTIDMYEHYIENRFFDNEGLASRKATRTFVREIERINPDVIHLHNIHDHYLNLPILFKYIAEKKIPVVWTQHDLWAITGKCCYIPTTCDRWKNNCFKCPLANRYSLDRSDRNHQLKKNVLKSLSSLTIVPVSEWVGGFISQSHLKERPMQVIYNGIDLNVFKFKDQKALNSYDIPDHKIVLLGVAFPWSERKGLRDFVELSKRLDERYVIVLVGLNEDQKKELPQNMIGLKRTQSQAELAGLYARADILLSLSYGETFGMTMAEAYACGTPCIVYDNTAQPEIVAPNTGRVAKTGEIEDVKRLVYEMTESDFKAKHTIDCRARAEQMYDKDKCFEQYIELYNRILK